MVRKNENTKKLSSDEWRRQIMLLLNKIDNPNLLAVIDAVINDIYTGKLRL